MIISKDNDYDEELSTEGAGEEFILDSSISYIMVGMIPMDYDSKGLIEYKIVDEWYEWEYGEMIERQCINLGRVKSVRQRNIRGTTKIEIRAV